VPVSHVPDGGANPPAGNLTHGRGTGYVVLSHLLAGMVAYGAIGWLAGRAIHVTVLFPVGMLVGLGISTALVIHRYGRLRTQTPHLASGGPEDQGRGNEDQGRGNEATAAGAARREELTGDR
jgi:F0F1-type ATP synthase assembly protein I